MFKEIIFFVLVITSLASKLHFDKDGKFRILVLTDVHYGKKTKIPLVSELDCSVQDAEQTVEDLRNLLKSKEFDLAVITGDLVNGFAYNAHEQKKDAFLKILEPFQSGTMPFAFTFGNHDYEVATDYVPNPFSGNNHDALENVMQEINEKFGDISLTRVNKIGQSLTNFALEIFTSETESEIGAMLYFLDSGRESCDGKKTDGCISKTQLDWLVQVAKDKAQENGKKIPGIEFHHIPSSELLDWWQRSDSKCRVSVKKDPVSCFESTNNEEKLSDFAEEIGLMASFVGHDHINLFDCTVDGYTISYSPKFGHCIYGESLGYRVIELRLMALGFTPTVQDSITTVLDHKFLSDIEVSTTIYNHLNNHDPVEYFATSYPRDTTKATCVPNINEEVYVRFLLISLFACVGYFFYHYLVITNISCPERALDTKSFIMSNFKHNCTCGVVLLCLHAVAFILTLQFLANGEMFGFSIMAFLGFASQVFAISCNFYLIRKGLKLWEKILTFLLNLVGSICFFSFVFMQSFTAIKIVFPILIGLSWIGLAIALLITENKTLFYIMTCLIPAVYYFVAFAFSVAFIPHTFPLTNACIILLFFFCVTSLFFCEIFAIRKMESKRFKHFCNGHVSSCCPKESFETMPLIPGFFVPLLMLFVFIIWVACNRTLTVNGNDPRSVLLVFALFLTIIIAIGGATVFAHWEKKLEENKVKDVKENKNEE